MDRKQFLASSSAFSLVQIPSPVGVNDLRVLLTVGRTDRIGVLACCATFVILSAGTGATRSVNVPRPSASEPRWSAVAPPLVPITNPGFRNSDVVFDEVPDDVTASRAFGTGGIFAFKPRIGSAYLVYVLTDRPELLAFPLDGGRAVQALFQAPDGLHVVFGADLQRTIPLPLNRP